MPDCMSLHQRLQSSPTAMPHPEQHISQSQAQIPHSETPPPQSWKSYVQQLGERFQVPITEPDNMLVLRGREPQRRLLIGTDHTFAVVSHGQATEVYDLLPDEEILFDITEAGDWVPYEIMHSDEALKDYQETLRQSGLPQMDMLNFDVEGFSAYILAKVAREEWIERV